MLWACVCAWQYHSTWGQVHHLTWWLECHLSPHLDHSWHGCNTMTQSIYPYAKYITHFGGCGEPHVGWGACDGAFWCCFDPLHTHLKLVAWHSMYSHTTSNQGTLGHIKAMCEDGMYVSCLGCVWCVCKAFVCMQATESTQFSL